MLAKREGKDLLLPMLSFFLLFVVRGRGLRSREMDRNLTRLTDIPSSTWNILSLPCALLVFLLERKTRRKRWIDMQREKKGHKELA